MKAKRMLTVMAFLAIAVGGGACSTPPLARVAPEEAQPTRTMETETATPSASTASTGDAVASPEAGQTGTPITVAMPTPIQEAAPIEEDCMAECHIPDPNEFFAAGAKPLPASHIGRTSCLECHTTAGAPVLPATHIGRLDPSCRGCHK